MEYMMLFNDSFRHRCHKGLVRAPGTVVFVRIDLIHFLARSHEWEATKPGLVCFVGFSFGGFLFIFGFLDFILGVVGLHCQYYIQVISWKDSYPNDILCAEWDVKI